MLDFPIAIFRPHSHHPTHPPKKKHKKQGNLEITSFDKNLWKEQQIPFPFNLPETNSKNTWKWACWKTIASFGDGHGWPIFMGICCLFQGVEEYPLP